MNPRYRHVDISGIKRCSDELAAGGYSSESALKFMSEYPREVAKLRRQARLRPVPVNGSRARGRRLGWFETILRDGSLGYFQRRADDCVQASVATLVQMSPDQVPDLQLDKQRQAGADISEIVRTVEQRFVEWADKHGLDILIHHKPPTEATRWIGVVTTANKFNDHFLIMSGEDCLWNVSHLLPPSKSEPIEQGALGVSFGDAPQAFTVDDISYGITIERR